LRQDRAAADGGISNELFSALCPAAEGGGTGVYRASAETHRLLRRRATGLDAVIDQREALPPCDYTVFLSALPLALSRPESEKLPERKNGASPEHRQQLRSPIAIARRVFWPELPASLCLEPNAARLKFWRERLAELGKAPFIAITWRAGFMPAPNALPSTAAVPSGDAPFDALARTFAASPGTLVSIQHAPEPDETDRLSAIAGRKVHDALRANSDLEDVLALLALADEYVCVSNACIHLRAGVGKSARVLVPWPPDWRWWAWGAASPWFPGFKLYRQQPDGNWTGALAQLAADLASERSS
jgi:hypothetical protein